MKKEIHFSVDDTFGCFKWLTKNKENVNSIFDSYVLRFAKELYSQYGIKTSFYCMFTDGEFTLEEVSDQWKREFIQNKEWMKFGFHAFDDSSRYNENDETRIAYEYNLCINALNRICGKECLTNKIRLHYFSASRETVHFLVQQGIKGLLCADDDRGSYDLLPAQEYIMRAEGRYYSEKTQCEYIPTRVRIENISNIEQVAEEVSCLPEKKVEVFTHEIYLKDESFRKKIFSLLNRI